MVATTLAACKGTLEVGITSDATPTTQHAHPGPLFLEGELQDTLIPLFPIEGVFLYRSVASFDDTIAVLRNELAASGWSLVEEKPLPGPSSGTILRFTDESDGLAEITVVIESDSGAVLVVLLGVEGPSEILPLPTMAIAPTSTVTNPNAPMIADAFDIVQTDGQMEYKTNLALSDVVTFYKTELGAADWYVNAEITAPDNHSVTLVFIRQDTVMQISVEPDPISEALMVSIAVK